MTHSLELALATVAALSLAFLPTTSSGSRGPSAGTPSLGHGDAIEVVYTDAFAALACDGCKNSFTDSMEAGDSYSCANGDRWTFTVGTPVVQNARCVPLGYICHFGGACTFARTGTLTFTDGGPGDCKLFYRVDDDLDYLSASNNLVLSLDSSVSCRAGQPGQEDCEYRTIEFYDSTNDGVNVVVMSWDVNFCCSRCPD